MARSHTSGRTTFQEAGQFATIARNISDLLRIDGSFNLTLRVHFDPTTIEPVKELLSAEVQDWAQDPRTEVLFYHVDNLSDDASAHVPQLGWSERKAVIAELRRLVPRSVSNQDMPYVCYAAQPNALVVRADGRLAKCTVALNDDTNTIGALLPDGRVAVDNAKAQVWMAGWSKFDRQTLACPYSTIKRASPAAA